MLRTISKQLFFYGILYMLILFVFAFMQANFTSNRALMSDMSTTERMMLMHNAVVTGTITTYNAITGKFNESK